MCPVAHKCEASCALSVLGKKAPDDCDDCVWSVPLDGVTRARHHAKCRPSMTLRPPSLLLPEDVGDRAEILAWGAEEHDRRSKG